MIKENKFSKSLYIVSTIFLAILAIFVLVIAIQSASNGYSSIFGYSFFRVSTGSMEPTLKVGTILVCDHEDIDNIEQGDIICFKSKSSSMYGAVITHRVVKIVEDNNTIKLETRGDNNNSSDAYYVDSSNLIGKVVHYYYFDLSSSNFFVFLNSKIGFLGIIVIPLLLICSFVLKESVESLLKDIKKQEYEYNKVVEENKSKILFDDYQTITKKDYDDLCDKLIKEIQDELREEKNK